MEAIFWLAGANALIWLGIGAYIAFLAARQRRLLRLIKNLELTHDADN